MNGFHAVIFDLLICGSFLWNIPCFAQARAYKVEKDIVFKTIDGQSLKAEMYLPLKQGLKPVVVVAHGGSWNKRAGDMQGICEDLATAGFAAFNITYRLAPQSLYPKAVEDVRDAVVWLRSHAEKYAVDPQQVSGWGYSAGAHLILLVGLDPTLGLKAIVAGGTPADLTAWPESPLVSRFLGFTFAQKPDLWKEASPVNHVQKNSPPVFLYHGEWDHLVEIEQMDKMQRALEDKSVPVKTLRVPLMGHIAVYFFSQQSINQGIEFISAQMKSEK